MLVVKDVFIPLSLLTYQFQLRYASPERQFDIFKLIQKNLNRYNPLTTIDIEGLDFPSNESSDDWEVCPVKDIDGLAAKFQITLPELTPDEVSDVFCFSGGKHVCL